MKKYDTYKDRFITDGINQIPAHWDSVRMKYIGYLYGGLSGKSAKDFNQSSNSNNKSFIPFTNIYNNQEIDIQNLQKVIIEEGEKQNQVEKNDLFFLMSSENYEDVGKSAVLTEDVKDTYLNSFCKGFRITKEEINSKFLNYLLFSNPFRHSIMIEANGFTRINLKIDKISGLEILIPPKEEQTIIANYLDKKTAEIDELIADKEKLLKLYDEEKTAVINDLVTGKKVWNGNAWTEPVEVKDSGIEWLGEIPEHWEVKKLKHLVSKVGSGVTPRGGAEVYLKNGIPLLRSQNVYFNGLRLDDVAYISEEVYNSMYNSRVLSGDVLLNITGGSIGRAYFIDDRLGKANVNQHVCIIRPLNNTETKYLYYIIKSEVGQKQIQYEQTGSGREGLNFEALKNFLIPFPQKEEQQTIVDYIESETDRIYTKIENTKKLIELLKEYRTALISEVVTGKVKVV